MEHFSFVVLAGLTGSGKTRLLRHLQADNFQILDFEHIAGHRGSAFGALLQEDRSCAQRDFLTALSLKLSFFNKELPVITEWKGRKVGSLKIPDLLYAQLLAAPTIWIERNRGSRIQELLEVYRDLPIKTLYQALFSLRPKLRDDVFGRALQAIKERNRAQFVQLMLSYYDDCSEYQANHHPIVQRINWTAQSIGEIATDLEHLRHSISREYPDKNRAVRPPFKSL